MRTARLTIVLQSARHSPCGSRIRGFRLSLAIALRFFTNHETRITKHGFYVFHESRNTAFFAVGAQGTRNQTPLPGPPLPPTVRGFPAHHFPAFPTISRQKNCPCASVSAPSDLLGRPHDECRWPQIRSTCGLLPMPRTQDETMQRKGNVLSCAISEPFCVALTVRRQSLTGNPVGSMV